MDDTLDTMDKSISENHLNKYDYVVGNPPWVEVKRLPDAIKIPIQKKYGVSNLYGAFIIQGMELLRPGGHLSYVVPRSFTGGRYYHKLRKKLKEETKINYISYYANRSQTFHGGDILQELVVFSFEKNKSPKEHKIRCIPCTDIDDFNKEKGFDIKQENIFSEHDLIMLLPDSIEEFKWLNRIASLKNLEEWGYRFSTGQLVLHRLKDYLRKKSAGGHHRIIYGSDIINGDGNFTFKNKPDYNNGKFPFAVTYGTQNYDGRYKNIKLAKSPSSIEKYVNRFEEVVICRRRSHKGDKRRFVGLYLSDELPNGYFLENGLNYIAKQKKIEHAPPLKAVYMILRSDLFEKYFNVISSNTQINKNDMYLLGFPSYKKETRRIYDDLCSLDHNSPVILNKLINKLYAQSVQDKTI